MTQKELINKNIGIEHEKGCVNYFLKNNDEKIDQWIIKKYSQQSSPIDVLAKNKITNEIIKAQVTWIDRELTGKFYSNGTFHGERTRTQVKNIIREAIEKKDKKYQIKDTKEVVLLLNGFHLWNILELFGIFKEPEDDDVKNLINDLSKKLPKNFKEVFIVTKKFNIRIK